MNTNTAVRFGLRLLALSLLCTSIASAQPGGPLPALFPADNWWNTDVSAAPFGCNGHVPISVW